MIVILFFGIYGAIDGGQENLTLVWRYRQPLSEFLAKGHLHQGSRPSRLSANDKGDNEVKPGAVHRSPGICLTTEEIPENLS